MMTTSSPADTYLPAAAFDRLLNSILHPAASLDPRGQLVETLGNAGIWSDTCLVDQDPAAMAAVQMTSMRSNMAHQPTDEDETALARYEVLLTELYADMIAMAKRKDAA